MKNSSDAIIIREDSAVFNQQCISIRWLRYFNYRVFTVGLGTVPFGIFLLFFSLLPFLFFLFSAFVSPPGHRHNPSSISKRSLRSYPYREKTFRGAWRQSKFRTFINCGPFKGAIAQRPVPPPLQRVNLQTTKYGGGRGARSRVRFQ